MKRTIALLLTLVMSISLFVGCGAAEKEQEETGEVVYAETVYFGSPFDLDSADPYGGTSSPTHNFTNATHSVLIKTDYITGELVGVLAQSWDDVNGDGTAWRLHLRENVKFHDGTTFDADDVVFTWNYAKDINNVVKVINSADVQVKEVIAEDAHTVLFDMNYAIPDFPAYLELKMYSKEAFDTMDKIEAAKVGTGPYKCGELITGVSYALERFDEYYEGIEKYPTKNIVAKVIPDLNTMATALQAGEIDYAFQLDANSFGTLMADPNLVHYETPGSFSYYIGFNCKRDTWKNAENRQAIAMAVNKEDLVNIYFNGGMGASISNNFCVTNGKGYDPNVEALPFDPEAAREIVDKNGLGDTELVIMSQPIYKGLAEVLQSNLKDIGITSRIDMVDGTNWTSLKGTYEYDIHIGDGCSYAGALLYNFNRFFTIGGSSNVAGIEEPEWEALMQETQTATTYDELLEIFSRMQQWVATNVPLVAYATSKMNAFAGKDVGGVVLAPTDNLQEYATLYKIVK